MEYIKNSYKSIRKSKWANLKKKNGQDIQTGNS